MTNRVSPQEHITQIYDSRIKNTEFLKLSRGVASLAESLLSGGKFINELIQNTDDALVLLNGTPRSTILRCSLKRDVLTVEHDGKQFDFVDVEKITTIAQSGIGDKRQEGVTGFKGIGFRSLLSIAKKVEIISGGYAFCFDSEYQKGKNLPWQFIPIWLEQPQKTSCNVTFIFHLNHPTKIQSQFETFLQNPLPLLYLRRLSQIDLELTDASTTVVANRVGESCELTVNSQVVNRWIMKEIVIEFTRQTRAKLPANETTCPARLRTAKSYSLTFGFLKTERGFVEAGSVLGETGDLFTTLPTKKRVGFPFLVNGEFLLNPQREDLQDELWNGWLLNRTGYYHFQLLSELAQTPLWGSVARLLAPEELDVPERFQTAYSEGFDVGAREFAWIPSEANLQTLLKLGECYIDKTGFYYRFGSKIQSLAQTWNKLPHSALEKQENIEAAVKKRCDNDIIETEKQITKALPTLSLSYDNEGYRLFFDILDFFRTTFPNPEQLLDTIWLPNVHRNLKSLKSLCLPLLPGEKPIPLPPPLY